MARNFIQGIYKPRNPQKYRGDPTNIVFRSSWERRAFEWADTNGSVLEWASEEIQIPYLCETDNRMHRYFVDLFLKIRDQNGIVKSYLVEIKPFAQTLPPKYPGKQTARYLQEAETFVKNQSKWKAARKFAQSNGIEFIVITEKELGIK
jgi:hypothetical protein